MKKDNRYFIFCDFDGVLVSWRDWIGRRYSYSGKYNPTKNHLRNLNNNTLLCIDRIFSRYLRYKNKVVYFIPTSSWSYVFRHYGDLDKFLKKKGCRYLKEFNLENEDCLNIINEYSDYNRNRCMEDGIESKERRCYLIKDFIKRFKIKNNHYICLDDEGKDVYSKYKLKMIKTDMYDGITYKNYQKLDEVVMKWEK